MTRGRGGLIFVQILLGHVILGHLMRVDFPLAKVVGFFNAGHDSRLERVAFFKQLVDTLRINTFSAGQTLQISRLLA